MGRDLDRDGFVRPNRTPRAYELWRSQVLGLRSQVETAVLFT